MLRFKTTRARSTRQPKLAAALGLLAASATFACWSPDPIPWAAVGEASETATLKRPPASAFTADTVVYLDASQSMRGYVTRTEGKSIYSSALEILQDSSTNGGRGFHLRLVGEEIGPVEDGERAGAAFDAATRDPGLYSSGATNLSAAFGEMGSPISNPSSSSQAGSATEGAPPVLSVLVTDGVESKPKTGVNPTGLKNALEELTAKGWAVAVLGVRSQFDGAIASEETGAQFVHRSGASRAQFRPFYIVLVSPDQGELDTFADALRAGIEDLIDTAAPDARGSASDLVRECRLTSAYASGAVEATMTCTDGSTLNPVKVTVQGTTPPRFSFVQDRRTHGFEVSVASIPWAPFATEALAKEALDELVAWRITRLAPPGDPNFDKYAYPSVEVVSSGVGPEGGLRVALKSSMPASSVRGSGSCVYRLEGYLDKARLRDAKGPAWVSAWSTDDDSRPSNAARTYRLARTLGAGLWGNDAVAAAPVARIYVRVTGS
jgi:hypothetical protein